MVVLGSITLLYLFGPERKLQCTFFGLFSYLFQLRVLLICVGVIPGVPSSRGCDACRKQKKSV
jgi:hypothetical protein